MIGMARKNNYYKEGIRDTTGNIVLAKGVLGMEDAGLWLQYIPFLSLVGAQRLVFL